MRFAIDAHAIGRHLTGNEVYVRSLLNALAAQGQDHEFVAYVSTESARKFISARVRTRQVSGNPYLRLGRDLALRVREDRPDLLHVQYTAPLACPSPVVVSVHDVSFLEHPEYFPLGRARQLQWSVRRTIRKAAKILTGTEFSKASILKVYGELAKDKVVVVPNAAASEFRPISPEAAADVVKDRFSIYHPFILSVGDLQPRKNHIGLIGAFAQLARAYPQFQHKLVLAGKDTWYANRVRKAARDSGVTDRIHFVGFVSDEDLLPLYNACDVFAFPSFYEGFGLPALEAMACGRAVVCSKTTALPEVVDSAAILFDPHKEDEIARAIADLLLHGELRARMERLGLKRAAQFSWQKTAQRTLEVFCGVAQKPSSAGAPASSASIVRR